MRFIHLNKNFFQSITLKVSRFKLVFTFAAFVKIIEQNLVHQTKSFYKKKYICCLVPPGPELPRWGKGGTNPTLPVHKINSIEESESCPHSTRKENTPPSKINPKTGENPKPKLVNNTGGEKEGDNEINNTLQEGFMFLFL